MFSSNPMSSNEFTPRRLKPRVNAFYEKLFQHPERIFPGLNFDEDARAFKEKLVLERFSPNSPYSRLLIEFGSGSGGHLLELAKMKPDTLCIGFEIRFKRAVRTIEKAKKEGIPNVLIFRGRSELVPQLLPLEDLMPSNALVVGQGLVDELYVNFPDPWEKERQKKHRILSKRLFSIAEQIMCKGGTVSIKTDHAEYFASFLDELGIDIEESNVQGFKELCFSPFGVETISWNLDQENPEGASEEGVRQVSEQGNDIPPEAKLRSEFENLFRYQGLPVHYARFRRL